MPAHQGSLHLSTRAIQRITWITLVALIASVALFAGYYIWDRYVHPDDRSPAERNIESMEQVIRQDPQNVDARVAVAEQYLAAAQYTKALEQAQEVLSLYSDNAGALLIAGIAQTRLGNPDAALGHLGKFVALHQGRPMAKADLALEAAYYFSGESHLQLNQPAKAIAVLEAALAISPTDADALYQLGLAYQANGQSELGLEQFQKAVRFVPDFAQAYHGMAASYSALGQSSGVTYAQGMELFSLRDYRNAQTHLESTVKALPDFAPAHLGLALTYEKRGQLELALAAIQRALELSPNEFAIQQAHGRIQAALDSQK